MAMLTKADAARQLGISRTTLYKLINDGKLSATPDGLIDTAELVRVLSTLNVHHKRPRTLLNTLHIDTQKQGSEHHTRPELTSSEHEERTSTGRQLTSSLNTAEHQLTSSYRDLVDILREQLQAAQERERDYREHIARLTTMLDQAQQQNQRLLDMPRSAPAPPRPAPGPRPRATPFPVSQQAEKRAPRPAAQGRPPALSQVPAFDTTKYSLGKLCPRGHEYAGTGHTLRRLPRHICPACDTEMARERRQAKRGSAS